MQNNGEFARSHIARRTHFYVKFWITYFCH